MHTIYAALLGKALRRVPLNRERWEMPDGDFIDVDFLAPGICQTVSHEAPLVVLFHGLEGNSDSHYAKAFARQAQLRGWRFALPHFRGCSGEMNRLPRAYHSGDSADIGWILGRFRILAGAAPLYVAGVSLGGNALLKWLGEGGASIAGWVRAAAGISAPLDLRLSGDALGRGFNRVYTRMFLASLKHKSAAKLALHPGIFDGAAMRRARNLREFDNAVTAPLHGFRDTDDYWTRASALPFLRAIAVPTLVLNAGDDPFVPTDALPEAQALPANVIMEAPPRGGHVAFVRGRFPGRLDWLPQRVFRHFDENAGGT